ncbi:hypothetical protein H5T52_06965 [Candidatus Bipolaricaulota bacterium]|nr:hypothetical protein [Candidatus Bipolaricaulota bacterium]
MTKLFCWGLLTVAVTSGAVYTNDTGGVTYGFRVEFAGPVVITSHSAALPVQSPEGEATALTFSGGEVPPGGSFWLSWRPSSVKIAHAEWVTSPEKVTAPNKLMRGVTFGAMYWPERNLELVEYNLDRLLTFGINSVALVVDWYVDDYTDPTIEPWYRDRPGFPDTNWYFPTLYDDEVRYIIREAHARGMTVFLKPHVDALNWAFGNPGRGELRPRGGDWDTLFASYTDFILHYAQLAEELGVEVLSVGCELETMTHTFAGLHDPDTRWRRIISRVREAYPGKLTYSCAFGGLPGVTWSSPNHITFWDALDYIGFEIYRGLTYKRDPTLSELKAAVREIFDDYVEQLATEYGKPVLVTEINYYSYDGVNTTPIDFPRDRPVDHGEQALCYEAVLSTVQDILEKKGYLAGLFWWAGYLVDPGADYSWVCQDRYDFFWFKPAQEVLRRYWGENGAQGS